MRLAIVADGADALADKLQTRRQAIGQSPAALPVLEQQGCFYRQLRRAPRVAFLFPGQGSQYAGMLRELVRAVVPAAATQCMQIDAVMRRLRLPDVRPDGLGNPDQLGTDMWVTQVAMLLADIDRACGARRLGIRPDLIAGHSYGEFAALTPPACGTLKA